MIFLMHDVFNMTFINTQDDHIWNRTILVIIFVIYYHNDIKVDFLVKWGEVYLLSKLNYILTQRKKKLFNTW